MYLLIFFRYRNFVNCDGTADEFYALMGAQMAIYPLPFRTSHAAWRLVAGDPVAAFPTGTKRAAIPLPLDLGPNSPMFYAVQNKAKMHGERGCPRVPGHGDRAAAECDVPGQVGQ